MEENKKMQKEKDSLLEYMEKNGTFRHSCKYP